MEAVTSGLASGITQIASDVMTSVGQIIPVALPVAGVIIVVGIGFKVFRKIAG